MYVINMNKELIKQIRKLTEIAYQLNFEYDKIKITTKNINKHLIDIPDQYKNNMYIILHKDINTRNTRVYIETLYNSIKNTYKNIKLLRYENKMIDISEFIKTYRYIQYLLKAKNNIYYAEQIINK